MLHPYFRIFRHAPLVEIQFVVRIASLDVEVIDLVSLNPLHLVQLEV